MFVLIEHAWKLYSKGSCGGFVPPPDSVKIQGDFASTSNSFSVYLNNGYPEFPQSVLKRTLKH